MIQFNVNQLVPTNRQETLTSVIFVAPQILLISCLVGIKVRQGPQRWSLRHSLPHDLAGCDFMRLQCLVWDKKTFVQGVIGPLPVLSWLFLLYRFAMPPSLQCPNILAAQSFGCRSLNSPTFLICWQSMACPGMHPVAPVSVIPFFLFSLPPNLRKLSL